MEINRDVYLNRLIVRKHNGFIKVITEIRSLDSAEDLIKISENPLVLGNEKEERKVDPSKFINWLLPQMSGGGMY